MNSLGSYDLSDSFVDDDGNPLSMTATSSFEEKQAQSLPVGILLTIKNMFTIAIAPTQMAELGTYLITVTASDTLATASSSFKISVFNTPPYFLSKFREDFTMRFNNTYFFSVPEFKDDERHNVTVLLESIPS